MRSSYRLLGGLVDAVNAERPRWLSLLNELSC